MPVLIDSKIPESGHVLYICAGIRIYISDHGTVDRNPRWPALRICACRLAFRLCHHGSSFRRRLLGVCGGIDLRQKRKLSADFYPFSDSGSDCTGVQCFNQRKTTLKAQLIWEGFEDAVGAKQCLIEILKVEADKKSPFHRWALALYKEISASQRKREVHGQSINGQ